MTKKVLATPAGAKTDGGVKIDGRANTGRKRLTGRLLVQFDGKAEPAAVMKGIDGFVLGRLRIGVVNAAGVDAVRKMAAAKNSPFVAVEPERYVRMLPVGSGGAGSGRGNSGRGGGPPFADSRTATWGIQAMNVLKSEYTGKGVKIAVLDTGFDFTHPDFALRSIHRKSFVGRQAIDKEGHGTHCAGIAVGGKKGKGGARYGVAPGARLYIGKILDDAGEGTDGDALAGIEWALEKGCRVISMSFGAEPEAAYSTIFENVAQTVMANRCLLIGATGNDSKRGRMAPVNHPANCPSIMAVGALTAGLKVAEFSCGGVGAGSSGQVDVVAPGEAILSARAGGGYMIDSGTSMATPFVAGMAALLWEQYPEATAWEIWARLGQQAQRLALPATAVGAGLVYAR